MPSTLQWRLCVPRRPNIQRPVRLHTTLPEDLRVKLDLYLYSHVEGKVPQGAYQKFLIDLIKGFFDKLPKEIPIDQR